VSDDLKTVDELVFDTREGFTPEPEQIDAAERVAAELRAAREAVGPAWFLDGCDLATAIQRKCTALERMAAHEEVGDAARKDLGS
jgi:hypothetical protein